MDKRRLEYNQSLSRQYAVSYAILAYHHKHPNEDAAAFGLDIIELMRALRPKFAVQEANKVLNGKNRNRKRKKTRYGIKSDKMAKL